MPVNFTNETVTFHGCRTTLRRGGAGRPLLYLHGAGGASVIPPFLQALAEEYTVWIPEHPGFGGSDEPEWLDSIHDMAFHYLDFLEHHDLRDTLVLGASIGGWTALEIAIRNTDRIRAMSLVGPSGIHVPGLRKGDLFLWTAEERARNLFVDQSFADRMLQVVPTADQIEIATKNSYTTARLAWEPRLFDPNLHKWLHRIKVPVQFIWGDQDKVLPVGYAAAYKGLMPHARVDIITQAGHLPQVEKADEFLRAFRAFASSLP